MSTLKCFPLTAYTTVHSDDRVQKAYPQMCTLPLQQVSRNTSSVQGGLCPSRGAKEALGWAMFPSHPERKGWCEGSRQPLSLCTQPFLSLFPLFFRLKVLRLSRACLCVSTSLLRLSCSVMCYKKPFVLTSLPLVSRASAQNLEGKGTLFVLPLGKCSFPLSFHS